MRPTALIQAMISNRRTGPALHMTSNSASPTCLPLTGSAISSKHVTCSACAAALGNSLKRQSHDGNGAGLFPAIAMQLVKDMTRRVTGSFLPNS